jgi:hypothetical protein
MLTMTCVHLPTRGFTWTRGAVAAVALAAAYLSKISAIALAAPLALALLEASIASTASAASTANTSDAARGEGVRLFARLPAQMSARLPRLAVLLVALVIVLPWSVRNVMLYGDPTAQSAMRTAVSHLITERSLFSNYFLWHFPLLTFASFIGVFGWANVFLPKWIYLAFAAFGAVAAGGVARGWYLRTIDPRVVRMLVLIVVAVLAVVVYINLMFTQPQGRYLLPALPAVALLAALGLTHLPAPLGPRLIVAAPIVMLLFNVWCLAGVIVPAYWPPLSRTIAPGVRVEHPAAVFDLAFIPPPRPGPAAAAGRNLLFEISAKDPWILMPADIDAADYDEIEIELMGTVPGVTAARGTVRFATDAHGFADTPGLEFSWRADGTRQVVRMPLLQQRRWRGTITHLRIDPIEEEQASTGGRIEFGAIQLRATPSSLK